MTSDLTNEITIGYDPASPSGDVPGITFMKGGKVLGVLVGEVATLIHNIMDENAKLLDGLLKISRTRRTYGGKPCKDIAADIADETLRSCEYRDA